MVVVAIVCADRVLDNNWMYLVVTAFGEFSPFLLPGLLALLGEKKNLLSAVVPPLGKHNKTKKKPNQKSSLPASLKLSKL